MSEKLLKIMLQELRTVRVLCQNKNCRGKVEAAVDDLETIYHSGKCPLCQGRLTSSASDDNEFTQLTRLFRVMNACAKDYRIEFVVPHAE